MTHTLIAMNSGRLIDISNIKFDDICLEDIAHHLCNINRFGGALPLRRPYSVASHSLNCFKIANIIYPEYPMLCRHALMHDAVEAYLGDVVSGLKQCLYEYKQLEEKVWDIIKKKYKIDDYYEMRVEEIDKRIMLDEAKTLLPKTYSIYKDRMPNHEPWDLVKIVPDKYPELIKDLFLRTCKEVGIYD